MHVPVQSAGNFFFRGTGLPTAVRKNQPLVFLHNHHVYLKKLHRGGYKECYCIKPTPAHVHNFIQ